MSRPVTESFSADEVEVLNFIFESLARGHSAHMALRHKAFTSVTKKVLGWKTRPPGIGHKATNDGTVPYCVAAIRDGILPLTTPIPITKDIGIYEQLPEHYVWCRYCIQAWEAVHKQPYPEQDKVEPASPESLPSPETARPVSTNRAIDHGS